MLAKICPNSNIIIFRFRLSSEMRRDMISVFQDLSINNQNFDYETIDRKGAKIWPLKQGVWQSLGYSTCSVIKPEAASPTGGDTRGCGPAAFRVLSHLTVVEFRSISPTYPALDVYKSSIVCPKLCYAARAFHQLWRRCPHEDVSFTKRVTHILRNWVCSPQKPLRHM